MAKKKTETVDESVRESINDFIQIGTISIESESSFIKRLLAFQNNGGFGTHLNQMIIERLKEIESADIIHFENGELVYPDKSE